MKHDHSTLPRLNDPVWLLFVPPILGRAWLLYCAGPASSWWFADLCSCLLILALSVGTWRIATMLAIRAQLSERGTERFIVMSTLGTLASPLYFALAESSGTAFNGDWPAFIMPGIHTHPVPLALDIARACILIIALGALGLVIVSCSIHIRSMRSYSTHSFVTQLYRLAGFPLLIGIGTVLLIALLSSLHISSIILRCTYILLALLLPYCTAAFFATPYIYAQWRLAQTKTPRAQQTRAYHICMLALIGVYFGSQLYTYAATNLIHP